MSFSGSKFQKIYYVFPRPGQAAAAASAAAAAAAAAMAAAMAAAIGHDQDLTKPSNHVKIESRKIIFDF